MASSSHDATFPRHPLTIRKFVIPAALASALTAALALWHRRTRVPSVSPMSDEWLRNRAIYRDQER